MEGKEYQQKLLEYKAYLFEEEKSENTIQKYMRDLNKFFVFLEEKEISKVEVVLFKEDIIKKYAPRSVNSMLAVVNGFLEWVGFSIYKVKPIKIQRNIFSVPEKELTEREYKRLIQTAEQQKNRKLSLLIQTICATGIRVSELQYITVASLHTGRAIVTCKGKNRIVFLPKELCKSLRIYCRAQNVKEGTIFITKTGKPLDRSNIWKMMKKLCNHTNIIEGKVFPHNLRHLFARTYYKIEKDISRLADILGHSSIETTRIYTIETGSEHIRLMNRMNLVYCKEITT